VLVADASAVVAALLATARSALGRDGQVHAPICWTLRSRARFAAGSVVASWAAARDGISSNAMAASGSRVVIRSLPGDPATRLTDVLPQMLTEQRVSKQNSPHLAKSFINHADRGFDDKRLRNSSCGASGFQP
jgi:hypothetical protein